MCRENPANAYAGSDDRDWLKAVLNHKNLPYMLEKDGSVTVVPVDRDLNGVTIGQAWLMLKGYRTWPRPESVRRRRLNEMTREPLPGSD